MKPATDDLILESLKTAIVQAFFTQQTMYDMHGTHRTYGGYASQLVAQILETPEFKTVLKEIAKDFKDQKETIQQLVGDAIRKKSEEALEKEIKEDKYYLNEAIRTAITREASTVANEAMKDNPRIRELVEAKVGKGKWNINISVAVAVTEGK